MKYIKFILAAVALISSTGAASANGRCGGNLGKCPSGTCCSKYGYCGTTEDYCGAGCQAKFGDCKSTKSKAKTTKKGKVTTTPKKVTTTTKKGKTTNKKVTTTPKKVTTTPKKVNTTPKKVTTTPKKVTTTPKKVTTTPKKVTTTPKKVTTTPKKVTTTTKKVTTTPKKVTTKTINVVKTTTTIKPTNKLPISTDGKCGPNYGICPENLCCSQYNYCGKTAEHCGTGCNPAYGICDDQNKKLTTTTTKKNNITKTTTKAANPTSNKKISTNGLCGPNNGNTICPDNKCCSQYGYCGTGEEYCEGGCKSEFGRCGYIPEEKVTGFQYYDHCVNKKHWALTFDDGPYKYDLALLSLLRKLNVKATFFINGANVMDIKSSQAKEIIQTMNKDGHVIASHTWSHANIEEISKSELISEMTKLEDYIYKYIGKKPAFMRPPYGAGDGNNEIAKTLKSLGYTAACMWNVDTLDWDKTGNVDYALSVFKKYVNKNVGILSLNHNYYGDISEKTLLTLVEAEVKYMRSQGYTPVTMDKCLGLKAYQ